MRHHGQHQQEQRDRTGSHFFVSRARARGVACEGDARGWVGRPAWKGGREGERAGKGVK